MQKAETIEVGDFISFTSQSDVYEVIRREKTRIKCKRYFSVMYVPYTVMVYKRDKPMLKRNYKHYAEIVNILHVN